MRPDLSPKGRAATAIRFPRWPHRQGQAAAFVRIDGLIIVAIIAIIAAALLPALSSAKRKAPQLRLVNAAGLGDLATVKSLVDQGVPIDCKSVKYAPIHTDVLKDYRLTPLSMAAFHNQTNVVNYLIEKGANVNLADENGRTPLMWLTFNGDEAVPTAKLLIQHGADVGARDNHGATVLDHARWWKPPKPQIIELLEAAQKTKAESRKP